MPGSFRKSGRRAPGNGRGFTLLEVLVALTIIAVALTAAMRGAMAITNNAREVDLRLYATLEAQNQLLEMRLLQSRALPIDSDFTCEQGGVKFHCRQHQLATPNPFFRWVEMHVTEADGSREYASMMALLRVQ
jgi:general secretion pathway protein I